MSPGTQYILLTTLWLSPDPICYCSIYLQYLSSILYDSYNSAQCSTLTVAHLPGATKTFTRAGKFRRVVAWSGNQEFIKYGSA